MRIFLAFELPTYFKEKIYKEIEEIKKIDTNDLKFVKKDNLHITFQYIGETTSDKIKEISQYTEDLAKKIFRFNIFEFKLKVIPNSINPKLIWISMNNDNKEIYDFSEKLRSYLIKKNYPVDKRSLKLHITIARFKKNKKIPVINEKEMFSNETIKIRYLTLFESILTKNGPTYKPIKRFKLNLS